MLSDDLRADETCRHCWHGDGTALMSMPAQYPEVCCWCGAKRNRRQTVWQEPRRPHGSYLPPGNRAWMEAPDAE